MYIESPVGWDGGQEAMGAVSTRELLGWDGVGELALGMPHLGSITHLL